MKFIKCEVSHFDSVALMYERCVRRLEENINFPKWSSNHPSREYIKESIKRGEMFIVVEGEKVFGAAVLNEDPEGNYCLGDWKNKLSEGEFLVDGSIAFAKKNGYKAIRLDIVPENLPAKNLYLSRGFESAGKKEKLRDIEYIPTFELFELNF